MRKNTHNNTYTQTTTEQRNMVTSLIQHERIETTFAKAKALQRAADRMVTWGKGGTKRDWVKATGYIREPAMAHKVFLEMADRYKHRPGGYTRVVRTRRRRGDNALMAYCEFVDRDGELLLRTPDECNAFARPLHVTLTVSSFNALILCISFTIE
jgi:large subunit ribosomal protein L17